MVVAGIDAAPDSQRTHSIGERSGDRDLALPSSPHCAPDDEQRFGQGQRGPEAASSTRMEACQIKALPSK